MTRNEATSQTSPFHLYKFWVAEAACVTIEALDAFAPRLHTAFDMGEPVWMIADELKLRAAAPSKTKTPRQLALRVVAF